VRVNALSFPGRLKKFNAFSDRLVIALNMMLRRFDAEAFTTIIRGAGRAFSTGAPSLT